MEKNTLLVYFYSDYPESFLNLYTSINNLNLLEPKEIYSILVVNSINHISDKTILKKFDKFLKLNSNSDLYGYFYAVNSINLNDYQNFIFMNSSCIGPILPEYFEAKNWQIIFTKYLKRYGLVSPIIEFPPFFDKHVENLKNSNLLKNLKELKTIPFAHSYFLALNKSAINEIIKYKGLPNQEINKDLAVGFYERMITALLISLDFNIKSMLKKYSDIEINRFSILNLIDKNEFKSLNKVAPTDPEVPENGYFGTDLNPYEVVFFKNIRYPHSHRNKQNSYISVRNSDFLDLIIGLTKNKEILQINSKTIKREEKNNFLNIKNNYLISKFKKNLNLLKNNE